MVYSALNGIRGVAALVVFLHHSEPLVGDVVPWGYVAVDLFFMLSGFVIAHAYDDRLANGLGAGRFLKLRLFRFYPLYFLGLVLGMAAFFARDLAILAGWADGATEGLDYLTSAFVLGLVFMPMVAGRDMFPLNAPAWSLFFELAINVVYAAGLFRASDRVLAAVSLAGLLALFWVLPAPTGLFDAPDYLLRGTARTLFAFPLGVLIYRHHRKIPRMPSWVAAVPCLPLFAPGLHDSSAFLFVSVAIVFPVGLALASRIEGSWRGAEWLGLISYPLYAIHWPLQQPVFAARHLIPGPVLAAGLLVFLLVACPLLASRYDVPARAWLTRVFSRRRQQHRRLSWDRF